MLGAKSLGIDACGEEQESMQPAWEMRVESLPEVFQMVLGKVVLNGRELVLRQRLTKGVADQMRMSQPGNSPSSFSQATRVCRCP